MVGYTDMVYTCPQTITHSSNVYSNLARGTDVVLLTVISTGGSVV